MDMYVFPTANRRAQNHHIPVERIWDTSFQEPISELETGISVKRIGDKGFFHSVSTYQIRLLITEKC